MKSNNPFKLFACLLALLLTVLFSTNTRADDVGSVDMGVTNAWNAAIGTTVNLGSAVKIDKQQGVGILMRIQGMASTTALGIVSLKRGNESDVYETNPPASLTFTNTANGVTPVWTYYEIPPDLLRNVDKLKINWVTNAHATVALTNCQVFIVKKAQR